MKKIYVTNIALSLLFVFICNLNSQTIWNGEPMTFTKPDFADWNLPENQDRITDDIWITRGNTQPIFNIADEDDIQWAPSPLYTQWAFGKISDGIENLDFDSWGRTIEFEPPSMVGEDMVLYSVTDSIYIDIKFTSWTSGSGNGGGGFSYERTTGTISENLWTSDVITFSKADSADWTLPENQDRITDNLWITRADAQGIFNIAMEDMYIRGLFGTRTDGSPIDTEWAFGKIADGVETLEFDLWGNTIFWTPPEMVGEDMVLHLISDDIYIDIKFTSWTSGQGNGGGGFSYERTTGTMSETLWTGAITTFTKTDSADWTLPENQDQITDNVWITRADAQGIFNIAQEESFTDVYISSPTKTRWAYGSTSDGIGNLSFSYFLYTIEFEPPLMIDQDMVLQLVPDDIYIDIKFTSWTSGSDAGGGGFSYIRSTKPNTSINGQSSPKETLICYPNPASEYIMIQSANGSSSRTLDLYDIQGRIVLSRELNGNKQVAVSHLSKGLYIYRIKEDGIIHHGRIIIE